MTTHLLKLTIALLSLAAFLLIAPTVNADQEANAQRIRDLTVSWVAAVAAKDIDKIVDLYAPEGYFMPPNTPPVQGRQPIGEAWRGLLELPGIAVTFGATRTDVSSSGDLAMDLGTYALGFDTEAGRVNDHGKYVVVWKRVNGEWKVAADIFNSNLPAK